ncbi:putative quinol monooxygenase [Caenispirillum bisanense]|uniref:Quinol monooxygenase YgiN n=1 Tax=Caenispirillum bisanense TaxID=414052 RepID=A0A286GJ40_9PROT|nr:antibiotic biosynthesis monooxygenase [Caenispirillum bisanense]SOD95520.1 Quinol monooxygenase YgiN [Caenispirillum bisanense]
MTRPDSVRKIVRITGRPGSTAALREALLALEPPTRAEPGCRGFTFYQALGTPAVFLLHEHFDSPAALEAHMAQPYTQAFFGLGLVEATAVVAAQWEE